MPFFTGPVSSRGPIVDAVVMVSGARRAALERAGQPIPEMQNVYALIDTGAACSAVDQAILDALGLTPTGESEFLTPSTGNTPQMAATYDVVIGILAPRGRAYITYPTPSKSLRRSSSRVRASRRLLGATFLPIAFFN